ncbi:MAG: hypothetical protein U0457_19245 [Candidatus Sericytochromatia bacterium]
MSVIFLLAKKQYNFIFINNPVHHLILKILILTERKTCKNCSNFIPKVSDITPNILISNVTNLDFLSGIYYDGSYNPNGGNGEKIPLLSTYYYNNILCR